MRVAILRDLTFEQDGNALSANPDRGWRIENVSESPTASGCAVRFRAAVPSVDARLDFDLAQHDGGVVGTIRYSDPGIPARCGFGFRVSGASTERATAAMPDAAVATGTASAPDLWRNHR